jgi:adenine-specific DNA-methyltransferase
VSEQSVNDKDLFTENQRLRERLSKFERNGGFGLVWESIPEAVEQRLVNEVPVLKHVPSLDVAGAIPSPSPHVLIEGDNLHALHVLQATHRGKVGVIYIDPPYNTGKEFIYNDRLIDAESGYRHSAWLSFMEKRLRLARELMSETATMFISINQIELAHLWLLLETIFGESNVDMMIWHKVSESGSAGQGKMKITHRFRNDSEYVVVVYRNKDAVRFNKPIKSKSYKRQYPNVDNDPRGPWISANFCKSADTSKPTGKNYYTVVSPAGVNFSRQWHCAEDEFKQLDDDGRIYWGQGTTVPRLKKFVDEPQPTTPTSLIAGSSQTDGIRDLEALIGSNKFDNPKPVDLIQYLIEIASQPDSIVLDFFAGSGTTLQAVSQANEHDGYSRRCILVTNNENGICREVTQPRIKAILTGDWESGPHDPLPGSLAFYATDFV